MKEFDSVWAKIKEEFRPQLTGMSFRTWIDVIVPVALENGILVLEVPDRNTLKTVNDLYYDIIQSAVKAVGGPAENTIFILPDDRDKYIRKEDEKPSAPPAGENKSLNPKYTFESFVIGKSNELSHAAALGVANNPGKEYNPLFIYGNAGLGKTHLMHAIGHQILKENPYAVITYVTSESFMNELITAIQQDKRMDFRDKYRGVDVLMIDDIQFISRSQATQEEFFNTFNALYADNKQIIISSDRPPKELEKFEERLTSRFMMGLITDILPPDLETRIAILKKRAETDNLAVSDDIINYIADNVHSNIRELEGCLNRVTVYAKLKRSPLTVATAAEALKDLLSLQEERPLTAERIKEIVADYYSVAVESLDSERRDKQIVIPRQVAMYLCQVKLDMPYRRVAEVFKRSDHTTAMNACKKVALMLENDAAFKVSYKDITERLK
ncbi:MAG: chromosomal replication initiator protein DnaA [Clostridia bacterium]|nr:chromosomal replication initiator protein DnaA [Clostridia bacterium]